MLNKYSSNFQLILSMIIFGTIGIFRNYIPLSSASLALARGVLGLLFLVAVILITKSNFSFKSIKNNLLILVLSGACIGFNWILLFEAYNYTSVSIATLCYYMAPIIVILLSPFVLKEKITFQKMLCVVLACIGMVFVSGVTSQSGINSTDLKGILFGLGAASLYACVILLNKKLKNISPYEKTVTQLFFSSIVILPYVLFTEDFSSISLDTKALLFVLAVGFIHTGLAYWLYFASMEKLKAQTIAVYSYIDPALAIILSALVLGENLGIFELLGAVLIFASTIIHELSDKVQKNNFNQQNH